MSAYRFPDHNKIKEIYERYGGWEKIVSPEYTPTEELLMEFEEAGLKREVFLGMRATEALPPRKRALQDIADYVARRWYHHISCARPPGSHDDELPVKGERSWTDLPELEYYWPSKQTLMIEQGITKADVEEELWAHPQRYKLQTQREANAEVLKAILLREGRRPIPAEHYSYPKTPYARDVERRLQRCFFPPKIEGHFDALVTFVLTAEGTISQMEISSSSGNAAFDEASMMAVKHASPYRPLPPNFLPGRIFKCAFREDWAGIVSEEQSDC